MDDPLDYTLRGELTARRLPNEIIEYTTFDSMGRVDERRVYKYRPSYQERVKSTYHYDAVGSALKLEQQFQGTNTVTTTWEYDNRYRILAEEIQIEGQFTNQTDYTWDAADNRLSKTNTTDGAWVSTTTYSTNALNQMTGYVTVGNGLTPTQIIYQYDDNGSRTNATTLVGGTQTASIDYTYDSDNRLISVTNAAATHTFAYDYRSRRYYRNVTGANPETTYHVFDGGLSVQEYNELPTATSSPTVEYIRGEGMGGGVGGMVYSIRPPAPGSSLPPSILCSHSNHRGDIIARSDSTGSLTSYAVYEAYGTRPYKWGSDPDRQKANTKEEETDLNLLNEGMRYRDLQTGTFMTRDPLGYADGPNIYCYVHCNPITHFDALGLSEEIVNQYKEAEEKAKSDEEKAKASYNAAKTKLADAEKAETETGKLLEMTISAYETYAKAKKLTRFYSKLYESAKNNGEWVEVSLSGIGRIKLQVLPDVVGINLAQDQSEIRYLNDPKIGESFVIFIHGNGFFKEEGNSFMTAENLAKFAKAIPTYNKKQSVLLAACRSANTEFHVNFTVSIDAQVTAPKSTIYGRTTNPPQKEGLQWHKKNWKQDFSRHLEPALGTVDWVDLTVEQAKKMQQ